MRTFFAAAVGLALAAAGAAAHAQQISFPAPAFRGGNTDWQVVLDTQRDLSVSYRVKVPEAAKALAGSLQQKAAPPGEYALTGTIGAEKAAVTFKIAAIAQGTKCMLNNGKSGDATGPYTHAILVLPAQSKPPATAEHKAWPKQWYGCGRFTLD